MKTRILKKISQKIRIVENASGGFDVETRNESDEWHTLNTYSMIKQALNKKHSYIVMVVMRDLGYRYEFVKRRTKRKKRK